MAAGRAPAHEAAFRAEFRSRRDALPACRRARRPLHRAPIEDCRRPPAASVAAAARASASIARRVSIVGGDHAFQRQQFASGRRRARPVFDRSDGRLGVKLKPFSIDAGRQQRLQAQSGTRLQPQSHGLKRARAISRSGASSASKPDGRRRRRSSPLPLTERASTLISPKAGALAEPKAGHAGEWSGHCLASVAGAFALDRGASAPHCDCARHRWRQRRGRPCRPPQRTNNRSQAD
jgi:hypothetical protein